MSTYDRILAAKRPAETDVARMRWLLNDVVWLGTDEGQRWLEARNRELAKARRER